MPRLNKRQAGLLSVLIACTFLVTSRRKADDASEVIRQSFAAASTILPECRVGAAEMSGRELAIDPNLVFELDQRLRHRAKSHHEHETSPRRPDVAVLIEAIERAANALSDKDHRIRRLETREAEFEDLIERMRTKLGELVRLHRSSEATAKFEAERADAAEAESQRLHSSVEDLEGNLEAATTDLRRIAEVIIGSFPVWGAR